MKASLVQRLLNRAIQIQQIPAPTFSEQPRADFVEQQFEREGLCDVSQDELGNVYGRLTGRGERPPLVVSAHTDTVFPADTELFSQMQDERLYGPGIGDNSLGVAGLFGLLWALHDSDVQLPGDLWLVANVGEEGLGDLRGMRAVVDRFGAQPLGYVVLEGMALGQVYHRGLGVKRYRITVRTSGGHSWVDYGRPSAVHDLAHLITRLTDLPVPRRPRTSLNVGVISGGTTINTIAACAELELDLRSEGEQALANLESQVRALVIAAERPGVEVKTTVIGQRPAGQIPANHPLVRAAQRSLKAQGLQPHLGVGSTDANIPLSRGLPSVCIGLTTGGGAHTTQEYIDTAPVETGLAQIVHLVENVWR